MKHYAGLEFKAGSGTLSISVEFFSLWWQCGHGLQ